MRLTFDIDIKKEATNLRVEFADMETADGREGKLLALEYLAESLATVHDDDLLDRVYALTARELNQRTRKPAGRGGKKWEFDEQAFIEQYCPMEGGNDNLGWIDDIHKLLDGEAEPGDSASTGEYANLSEDELRKELNRLMAIVLKQAFDEYIKRNY